jgi:hypothetical protein
MILSMSAPSSVRLLRSTVFNGRIHIEKINEPFLFQLRSTQRNTRRILSARLPTAGSPCTRAALREAHRGGRGAICLVHHAWATGLNKSAFEGEAGLLFSI